MLIVVIDRRGAPGGKLKMTLGLPVYVAFPRILDSSTPTPIPIPFLFISHDYHRIGKRRIVERNRIKR